MDQTQSWSSLERPIIIHDKITNMSCHITSRHYESLQHALRIILSSDVCIYVNQIILYGSCARSECRYQSDVDLFIELDDRIRDNPNASRMLMLLRSYANPDSWKIPEVETHFTIGTHWHDDISVFFQAVRNDGICVYCKKIE